MIRKLAVGTCAATLALVSPAITQAQDKQATPRERAGAMVFGVHCSVCHGVRLMKQDAAYDLAAAVKNMDEERFVRAAKTRRGAMPSFAGLLKDTELGDVYAYVKRGHSADLDDVPMESNH